MRNCGKCHTCGNGLRKVLDGEEWCDACQTYRRYQSHGWSREQSVGDEQRCPDVDPRLTALPVEPVKRGGIMFK